MSLLNILQVLDRAHNGPVVSLKEWDSRVIPTKIASKLKEHNIRNTCNSENPVNTDDALADEFFKAGFELAVETGMLCQTTERVIEVTKEEILDGLKNAPSKLELGSGPDKILMQHRKPEDPIKPTIACPLSIEVSEDIWVQLLTGILLDKNIDINEGPSLTTIMGRPVLAGSPYETLVGRVEAQMRHEALWRAGRMGMPLQQVSSATTCFGPMGGFGIPGGYDADNLALTLFPSELKCSYD